MLADVDLRRSSVETILEGQYRSGAYIAAPSFPTYRYCWIRDGSFIAWAMDLAGGHRSAGAFHRWMASVVSRRQGRVEALERAVPDVLDDSVILHTRYTLDGEEGAERWSNFQLDGYGFWLSSLAHHLEATGAPAGEFLPAVDLVVRYLRLLWERPCYDFWEEFPEHIHPTSLAAVAGGLGRAAALLGRPDVAELGSEVKARVLSSGTSGRGLAKFEGSSEVDGSALLVLGPFGPFGIDEPVVSATVDRIESELVAEGGVHRYPRDEYFGGGLWVPLSGALAWIHAARGDAGRAAEVVAWIEGVATDLGHLPEQVSRHLLLPGRLQPWIDRWGPVASPLLWSHAMYLAARSSLA